MSARSWASQAAPCGSSSSYASASVALNMRPILPKMACSSSCPSSGASTPLRMLSCLAHVAAKGEGGGCDAAAAAPPGHAAACAGSALMLSDSRSRMMPTSLEHTSS
jgi:hypothetical protein